MALQVIVIGGFSDLCKRGMIERIVRNLSNTASSPNVIIVLNGEEDFVSNSDLSESIDVRVELFAEGCFCCGLKYELKSVLTELINKSEPDFIIMTVSVITDLELVSELMREIANNNLDLTSIYGFDLKDANDLIKAFPEMVDRNIVSSESVMLLKDDSWNDDIEERTIASIRAINPKLTACSEFYVRGKEAIVISNGAANSKERSIWKYIFN